MDQISYLYFNGREIIKFKAKHSEIVATPLCLGKLSEDASTDNMERQDYMEMSTILVLIILLQLMIYWTFTSI